ncbi:MAG: hypothetical protein UT17_C0003G0274 [Candidatus Woesebacteria bacterium GW2011_GWB1_39_10]|uniref:Uncharacterized protein n=2 Tax=Candidatus Woeseibacteriota TaxID=1752722 RepID=A0A0G0PSC8_9BACT|nr:MAG: hypothetical protein UT17_C0003G0274 [Candidatus Woesebacteria bacterium GW2011_GWB1_39_10]KKS91211.1 MAG: hypothetical protein UV66_C0001G0568 [Candidatus Woesebacteria bacterium GW2011_GWA1_43_12]
MEEAKKCPKDGGAMEEGETKSKGGYAGKNIWGQGGLNWLGGFKKNEKPVITFRCNSCGYLESYSK